MTRSLSPIHRPLEEESPEIEPVRASIPSRIAILAQLDSRTLAGRVHSIGPGGASALFSRAVEKALVDEMAEQLREGPFEPQESDSEVRKWAAAILEAFEEV